MPYRPLSICLEPNCSNPVASGKCDEHTTDQRRLADLQRPNGYQRGYTREWAAFSRAYLDRNPFCTSTMCTPLPLYQRPLSTEVDHTGGHSRTCAHKYDQQHMQALCHACHSIKTARDDGSFGRTKVQRCTAV